MKSTKRETSIERRLRELQEQSELLKSDISTLSRTLRKYDATAVAPPPVAAPPPAESRRSRLNPNYAATVGTGTTTSMAVTNQEAEPSPDEAEPNLFTVTPSSAAEEPYAATHSNTVASAPRYRRVVTPARPQKQLANYLSSGSFNNSPVPLSHERRVQRFKAIFLTVCAATFTYIIYCAVFR